MVQEICAVAPSEVIVSRHVCHIPYHPEDCGEDGYKDDRNDLLLVACGKRSRLGCSFLLSGYELSLVVLERLLAGIAERLAVQDEPCGVNE